MAKVVQEQVTMYLRALVNEKLKQIDVDEGAKFAAEEVSNIIRERTSMGYDVNMKRLPPLSAKYKAWKLRAIKGKGKAKIKSSEVDGEDKYRAIKVPNHIRLSGGTFAAFKSTVNTASINGSKITVSFRVTNTRKVGNENLLNYLRKMGRDIFGLSTDEKRQKKEQKQIIKAFIKGSGIKVSGKFKK